jgi:hypothetical protein
MRNKTFGLIAGVLAVAVLAFSTVSATFAQTQPTAESGGMMGGGRIGAGVMGQGGMMGGYGAQQTAPLASVDAAQQAFQAYVDRTGNQDLVLDEVMQFQWNYYAIVKEKSSGSGAFELLADPRTGAVFPEMGPNMMWNTKYSPMVTHGGGMMSGAWGPTTATAQPTVTAAQAQQIAQQWLDQYQPGSATETPDSFPGYYTLHITRDGEISGMLSVNAYTGQVWFHTWHGAFVASSEA